MRVAIRVFIQRKLQSEELISVDPAKLETLLPELARKHGAMMAHDPGMVEIEFLDEPDPNSRFFRIGTDPSHMVQPIGFKL